MWSYDPVNDTLITLYNFDCADIYGIEEENIFKVESKLHKPTQLQPVENQPFHVHIFYDHVIIDQFKIEVNRKYRLDLQYIICFLLNVCFLKK